MNIKNIIQVREMLANAYGMLDMIEESVGLPSEIEIPLRDIFKHESLKVVLYFAATDGKLTNDEVVFANNVFDLELDAAGFAQFIDECNIYSTEFETSGLFSLDIVRNVDKNTGLSGVDVLLDILEVVAKAICISDDNASEQETRELNTYFNNLKRRYDQNNVSLNKKSSGDSANNNSLKEYYLKKKM